MQNESNYYKHKFNLTLQPVIQLLDYKKTKLDSTEWIRFMESTKSSIINNPEQYLGKELPGSETIKQAVEEIFFEIVESQNIMA